MPYRVFTQTFCGAGALIERAGKILLVREHHPGHPDDGKWNQPAGWVDVGEDPLLAAVREVREETGLILTPTHLLGVYSLARKDITGPRGTPHVFKLIFLGSISGPVGKPAGDEISAIRWFTSAEIYAMDGKTLRDRDIKDEVRDYLAGKRYPLGLITHTVQE